MSVGGERLCERRALSFGDRLTDTCEYSFVSQVCHCWCPPFSAGHVAFLFICLPGLSLLVSSLFRWPCSISVHLSPKCVTAGVCPFPLAMQHFYSFPKQFCRYVGFVTSFLRCVRPFCHGWCPPISAGHAAFQFFCFPCGLFTFVFQVRCLHCWHPPFSPFQHFSSFVSQVISVLPQTGYCQGL